LNLPVSESRGKNGGQKNLVKKATGRVLFSEVKLKGKHLMVRGPLGGKRQ